MSLSKEWFEYHLTPSGWVEGSRRIDPGKTIEVDSPSDKVLSVRGHEVLPHVKSEPYCSVEAIWLHPDRELLKKLTDQYGKLPPGCDHWGDYNF